MALLTGISSITKGVEATITLNKAELLAIPAVAASSDFSSDKIKEVKVVYKDSASKNQRKELVFDFSQASPTDTILFHPMGKDMFDVVDIVIFDHDAGFLEVPQAQIPSLTISL